MSDENERSVASAGSRPVAIMSWEQADQIIQDQRAEIERLRVNLRLADAGFTFGPPSLTDAEREAVEVMERVANRTETLVVGIGPRHAKRLHGPAIAATLLGLLKRLG